MERFLRNKDLIPNEKLKTVGIVGLGGIGSQLVPLLSIMGFNSIHGWDYDTLEEHNLSTTLYPQNALGKPKAEIAQAMTQMYAVHPDKMVFHNKPYDESCGTLPCMIVCTDDMESRKNLFDKWSALDNKDFFIDGRMGATTVELCTQTSRTPEHTYMDEWIPTDSVPKPPCSMKHTVFAAQFIAAQIVSQVYNIVGNLSYYDYINTCLSPHLVTYGNQIIPRINTEEYTYDRSTQS